MATKEETSLWELISMRIIQSEGGFERVFMKVPQAVRRRKGHVHLESSGKDSKGRIGGSPGEVCI